MYTHKKKLCYTGNSEYYHMISILNITVQLQEDYTKNSQQLLHFNKKCLKMIIW